MKDNEITKAMECCVDRRCTECIRLRNNIPQEDDCRLNLIHDTLDLIKRQQAEIERLQTEKDNLITTYKECMVDIIKAFADKIKAQDGNAFITEWYESADICYEFDNEAYEKCIDNLTQEFVEAKYDR